MRMTSLVLQRICLTVVTLLMLGCRSYSLEKEFFVQPLGTRLERMRQYSLEDQYRIFRYGNDVVHPPLTDLANPIAEKGSVAIPLLIDHLNADDDDFTVRDTLLVLERMQSSGSYDVKSDAAVMTTLDSKVSTVKDKEWRTTCLKMLERIRGG